MREIPGVTMVCADTTRSRAYLQNMARAGIRPMRVLVLSRPAASLPGQGTGVLPSAPGHAADDPLWRAGHFDPNSALDDDLERLASPVTRCGSADINAPETVAAVAGLPGDTAIYSGFGGQILRREVLSAGKRFLHVHGGYLPRFRGSTTNYYSLLAEGRLGASAIFLTAEIDAGPVLLRRRVPAPPDRTAIDHLHDSALRAQVLCAVLTGYLAQGRWPSDPPGPGEPARTHYVIHPVLKHLAVFGHPGEG